MALSSTGLKNIHEKIQPMMETNETLLRTELGTINDGSEITTAQLLRLQYLIARYTVTATTFANIVKEMSDSLKGVASKIG
jgi:hypothetical protein